MKFADFEDGKFNICKDIICMTCYHLLVDIADTKLCAGDRNDVGACLGDSGGPLVTLQRADDKRCKKKSFYK